MYLEQHTCLLRLCEESLVLVVVLQTGDVDHHNLDHGMLMVMTDVVEASRYHPLEKR